MPFTYLTGKDNKLLSLPVEAVKRERRSTHISGEMYVMKEINRSCVEYAARRHAKEELKKVNAVCKIAAVLTWCYLLAMLLLTAEGIVEMPRVAFWYALYAAAAIGVVVCDDNSLITLKTAVYLVSSFAWIIIGTVARVLYWGLSEVPNIPSFWASSCNRAITIARQFKNVE